tara:strand:+ start:199012 stop:199224 length:213 start_codon:yes stop_codon:yes gene_type:complete
MGVLQVKQQEIKQLKISYSIKGAVEATDYSRSYIFEAIRKNELKTFLRGKRRFILYNDLVEFIHRQAGKV